jgi:hypothetical protein
MSAKMMRRCRFYKQNQNIKLVLRNSCIKLRIINSWVKGKIGGKRAMETKGTYHNKTKIVQCKNRCTKTSTLMEGI